MEILKVARVFIYLSTRITCSHTVLVRTTVRINRLPPPPTPTPGFQYGCCSGRGGAYWRFSLPCHFILYLPWPSISWGCLNEQMPVCSRFLGMMPSGLILPLFYAIYLVSTWNSKLMICRQNTFHSLWTIKFTISSVYNMNLTALPASLNFYILGCKIKYYIL